MRYIVGFLIAIGLIVLVFILILKSFGSKNTQATSAPLINYADSATVMQMTIDGPITADSTHQSLEISVGETETEFQTFKGYQGTPNVQTSYANNPTAYADFLRALDLAGYTKGNTSSALADDRGYCSAGERYVLEINTYGNDSERFWSSSCGQGTFHGNLGVVVSLFEAQVPDFSQQLSNGNISFSTGVGL